MFKQLYMYCHNKVKYTHDQVVKLCVRSQITVSNCTCTILKIIITKSLFCEAMNLCRRFAYTLKNQNMQSESFNYIYGCLYLTFCVHCYWTMVVIVAVKLKPSIASIGSFLHCSAGLSLRQSRQPA